MKTQPETIDLEHSFPKWNSNISYFGKNYLVTFIGYFIAWLFKAFNMLIEYVICSCDYPGENVVGITFHVLLTTELFFL